MLSADTLALLRSGAVLGRTFDPDIAGGLAELSAGRVLDACDEALLSGLITEPSAIELSFSHALIQSAVYEATSARRRLGLHRAAATLLAERLEGPRKEFADYKQDVIVGASLQVSAPLGQYDDSRLINIGTNRW